LAQEDETSHHTMNRFRTK